MLTEEVINDFSIKINLELAGKLDLKWDVDKKGVVCGWCRLVDYDDIEKVAKLIASFKGRVMTITPLNTPAIIADNAPDEALVKEKSVSLIINYHFFFEGVNFTVRITLPDIDRTVKSITPVLKSADWHEREMQELYNIKLEGHPNSKRLFLDENIYMTDHTMIPLSEAMTGASTNTLWEKIMKSDRKEAKIGE
ncbi:NADH-quinone oxidoreductase subunit C [Neobacillus sp. LXY-4]|uniref:NADH-quinone oxidoreductase subunit C n=1 Tax=Neobacillus sp. LXY-4 TaxID=3379826 RepID=UPI003EE35AAF